MQEMRGWSPGSPGDWLPPHFTCSFIFNYRAEGAKPPRLSQK